MYALPGADPVDVAGVTWDCHPTCVTAALRLGLPVMRKPAVLHMGFAPGRNASGRHAWPGNTVKVHMSERLRWRSGAVADVIDAAARCVTALEQLAMVDSALNQRLMAEEELEDFRYTPRRRLRWLAQQCDSRSQSPLETFARVALREAGLEVRPQVPIAGVGRVDLLVNGLVIVETDGRATHAMEAAFDADRRRDRAAALAGYVVLRFGYRDVVDHMELLVAEVRAATALWSRVASW
ncbi:MAG: GxxExxY protein [Demequinaceae bacterium]|nr:GxxExxY protein [Demequinaceae bacterium]